MKNRNAQLVNIIVVFAILAFAGGTPKGTQARKMAGSQSKMIDHPADGNLIDLGSDSLVRAGFIKSHLSEIKTNDTPTPAVDYLTPDSDLLPFEAKNAILLALASWPYDPPKNGRFSILSIRRETTWALATLSSADLSSPPPPGQDTSVLNGMLASLVVVYDDNVWKAAVQGDPNIVELLDLVPDTELSATAKKALFSTDSSISAGINSIQQAYTDYKFPWPPDRPWHNHTGWHGYANLAIDFDVVDNTNADVLSAAPGYLTSLVQCSPSDHYILRITTDNTYETMTYVHLSGSTVRAEGLQQGDYMPQGRKLGQMAGAFSGWDTCGIVSTGTHLHLEFPQKPFTIDGHTYTDTYWYNGAYLYSTIFENPSCPDSDGVMKSANANAACTTSPPGSFSKLSPIDETGDQPNSLSLSWETSSGASSYEYCFDDSDDDECSNWMDNGKSTSSQINDLSPGRNYHWNVRALNSDGTIYANDDNDSYWTFTTGPAFLPTNSAYLPLATGNQHSEYRYLYVTNTINGVSVIDATINEIVGTIPTDSAGTGIISGGPAGDSAYCADSSKNRISVINLLENTVATTIPVGHTPITPAISPDGARLYVTNRGSDSVSVIDTEENDVVHTITGVRSPWGVALNPDGSHIAVTSYLDGIVYIFDTSNFQEIAEIPVETNPEGIIYHPDGMKLFVANHASGTISVIDTTQNIVSQTITIAGNQGDNPVQFAFNRDANRLYVASEDSGEAIEIDAQTGEVLRRFVAGAYPQDVEVVNNFLYVTNSGSNSVTIIDLDTGLVVKTIQGFEGPHSITR